MHRTLLLPLWTASCFSSTPPAYDGSLDGGVEDVVADGGADDVVCEPDHAAWTVEEIGRDGLGRIAIAVEPTGVIDVAYSQRGPLRFLSKRSGSWTAETVVEGVAMQPWLTLDGSGAAGIGYHDDWYAASFATNASGTWIAEAVDGEDTPPDQDSASAAFASDGSVHLVYRRGAPGFRFRHATGALGAWSIEPIAPAVAGTDTAMTVDSRGVVHVVYLSLNDPKNGVLVRYATNESGSWSQDVVHDPGSTGNCSMALGPDDAPRIFCVGDSATFYGSRSDGAWTLEEVDLPAGADFLFCWLRGQALAIDVDGAAHVVVGCGATATYATNHGGVWWTEPIAPADGASASLALSAENVEVAFNRWDERDGSHVEHAWRPRPDAGDCEGN